MIALLVDKNGTKTLQVNEQSERSPSDKNKPTPEMTKYDLPRLAFLQQVEQELAEVFLRPLFFHFPLLMAEL